MFWESVVGIGVLTLLVVVMGPAFWSSRLSLSEKQKQLEKQGEQRPKSGP